MQSLSSLLTLSYQIRVAAIFLWLLLSTAPCMEELLIDPPTQAWKSIIQKSLAIGVPQVIVRIAKVSVSLSLSKNIHYPLIPLIM